MKYLELISGVKAGKNSVLCVALCHNEYNILQEFLDHYRSLGDISFLIVDDRSTDGSKEFLLNQPDVTLFQPSSSSTYQEHKRYWRQELLDLYAEGKWCLVPDIDEHFVYLGMEDKSLSDLITEIENMGGKAMHGIMLDMYSDKPLAEHIYTGCGLRSTFPFFDGPESYWVMATPLGFRSKFPTPSAMVFGGMRERIFFGKGWFSSIIKNCLSRISCIPFHEAQNRFESYKYEFIRRAVRFISNAPEMPPLNSTKLPLVKWERGYFFNGGAHAINNELQLHTESAALLHYRFTRGIDGLKYSALRGQHAADGSYCKRMWNIATSSRETPVCALSRRFVNSFSLRDLLLSAPKASNHK